MGLGRNLGSQPSPVGRGCRASAFSSAEARRVRGSFHSQANRCYTVPVLISTQRVRELRRISLLRIPNGLVLEDPEGFVGKVRKAMKARACRAQQKPLTRPATADDTAVAGHPLPKGEGCLPKFTWHLLQQRRLDSSLEFRRKFSALCGQVKDIDRLLAFGVDQGDLDVAA